MTTYVLDASAILRYLDEEPGTDRIEELLLAHADNKVEIAISAVQWGEVACKLFQRFDWVRYEHIMSQLYSLGLTIEPATAERAVSAGILKAATKIAYADAFCVQVALDSPQHTLVTADYGFKLAEHLVTIEFLPAK
jgi:PIN domain nuclease of toxin-antitoxin system